MTNEIAEVLYTEEIYQIQGRTVVVSSEPWEKVSEGGRSLLQKILQAVNLSLDSVTIVHQSTLDFDRIPLQPARVIFFGTTSDVAPFEPFRIGTAQAINSPSLEHLLNDAAAKQKLWAGLKVLFSR